MHIICLSPYMYVYIYTFVYNVNIIIDRYSLKAAQDSKFMFPNLTSLYWPLIRTLWSQGTIWPKSSVLYLSSLRSCIRILMSLGKVVVKWSFHKIIGKSYNSKGEVWCYLFQKPTKKTCARETFWTNEQLKKTDRLPGLSTHGMQFRPLQEGSWNFALLALKIPPLNQTANGMRLATCCMFLFLKK